ncbi:iron-containing redox enzyme family protein [Nonomuraea sp. NPDC050790]|uniref:iron-containing redox enzyme family protein n=1 Tax=Nonomuraea sp. NPDC050790 TaxID=3364371 RepID=UPI0037965E84
MSVLPGPRGPLSEAVIAALSVPGVEGAWPAVPDDPFCEDLQLALYVCYELHYRGFDRVAPAWEWDPDLLRLRAAMEDVFLSGLREVTDGGADVPSVLEDLLVERADDEGVSHHLRDHAELWQLREYVVHRSVYHLKEADPHAWVIPRLSGRAKAALVAVEFDEFGGGRAEMVHARLFADLMDELGLDSGYGFYLDRVPAPMLAIVNMMSLYGLHRRLRGALVGHFAAAEITTAPSADRIDRGLRRLGVEAIFFSEHVEADAVHELVLRRDVIGDLLLTEPDLAADVVLGVQTTQALEGRFADHVLEHWRSTDGPRSSLRAGPLTPVRGTAEAAG